jgi:hypothetical protein
MLISFSPIICSYSIMGSAEKFCLRWNDFESNISSSFRELRDDSDFFDVTLCCGEDGRHQLQAHKVILSACSPFFRNVLKRAPNTNPFLYLRGVTIEDLTAVLNFMYHGEANVTQEELNSFLAVAEDLSVKGLTQNDQQKATKKSRVESSSKAKRKEDAVAPSPSFAGAKKRRLEAEDDEEDLSVPSTSSAAAGTRDDSIVKSEAVNDDNFGDYSLEDVYDDDGGGGEGYEDDGGDLGEVDDGTFGNGDGEGDPIAGTSADGMKGRDEKPFLMWRLGSRLCALPGRHMIICTVHGAVATTRKYLDG